jgi:hypothetical protein
MKIGDKIKFDSEKQRYTIQSCDERFAILTKPFNARRTYHYTIVDLKRGVRGACNLLFNLTVDANTPEGAAENLRMLQDGRQAVSQRNFVWLSPNEIYQLMGECNDDQV